MTVFFAFNELESLDFISNTAQVVASTSSVIAISGVNRAGFIMESTSTAYKTFTGISEGWAHSRCYFRENDLYSSATPSFAFMLSRGGTTDRLCAIYQKANQDNIFFIDYTGNNVEIDLGAPGTYWIDIHFKINASGFIKLFKDQTLVYSYFGDTLFASGAQEVDRLYFSGSGNIYDNNGYSNIILSDSPTLGARVYTLPITAGFDNDFLGTLSNISGTGYASSPLTAVNVGDRLIVDKSDIPAISAGSYIANVSMVLSASYTTGSAATNLQPLHYNGTTVVNYGAELDLTESFATYTVNFPTNPDTAANWTSAELNAFQFGVEAKA